MDLRQLTHSEVRKCDFCDEEELQRVVVSSWIHYPKYGNPVQYSTFSTECKGCMVVYTTPAQGKINKVLGIVANKAANCQYGEHDEFLDEFLD